jgi:hypothetical protein
MAGALAQSLARMGDARKTIFCPAWWRPPAPEVTITD